MDKSEKLMVGIGIYVTLAVGAYISRINSRANSVYIRDLNGDGRTDIVVESFCGKSVFIQQEDGKYVRLDKLLKLQKKSIESKLEESTKN